MTLCGDKNPRPPTEFCARLLGHAGHHTGSDGCVWANDDLPLFANEAAPLPKEPAPLRAPIEYQETSREAYESFLPVSAIVDEKILAALRATGGCTDARGETITGLKHQTYAANRRHLVERGKVKPSGRFAAPAGRRMNIWEIVDDPNKEDGNGNGNGSV